MRERLLRRRRVLRVGLQPMCEACTAARKGSGIDGECAPIADGSDPDTECTAEPATSCGTTGTCNGARACKLHPVGTSCGPGQCSGIERIPAECDGFGSCATGTPASCVPYVCQNGTCPTSCSADADCVTGFYCVNGSCNGKRAPGETCSAGNQCASGFCVESVCCGGACDGVCQSCTAAGKGSGIDGECGNAAQGLDPQGSCTDEGVTSCGRDGTCDGASACRYYAAGAACGATCRNDAAITMLCNGSGSCLEGGTSPCAPFACNAGGCRTGCTSDTDCSAGSYCNTSSVCVVKQSNGTACNDAGVCASGHCVDGVCCDSTCGGQCEACDLTTATGTCSPVLGAPHGDRPGCSGATGADPCNASSCDGNVDRTSCAGKAGVDVACRAASCSEDIETLAATCDGSGACPATVTRSCKPFGCASNRCADTCMSDADCAVGNRCDVASGSCLPSSICDGDHTVTGANGVVTDCAPLRCTSSGECLTRCASTEECVKGFVCGPSGQCVAAANETTTAEGDDGGGCSCRTVARPSPTPAMLGLLALLILRRRRRQRAA